MVDYDIILMFSPTMIWYKMSMYSASKHLETKWQFLLTISKKSVDLNCRLQTIWIEIRPRETWSLIFDPYCLIPSINFCWKLVVSHGMTWIWGHRHFVNSKNYPRTFEGHCLLPLFIYLPSKWRFSTVLENYSTCFETDDIFSAIIWNITG